MSYRMLQSHVHCMDLGEKNEEILSLLTEEDSNSGDNIKPHQPDLKPLPAELKHAFLDKDNHCPVVISSLLNTL